MNRKMPFTPTEEMKQLNPKLMTYAEEIVFNDVWLDETLSSKERSLITLSVLAALGNTEQMPYHIDCAYKNGLSQTELVALTTHLTFYIGLPSSMLLLNKLVNRTEAF